MLTRENQMLRLRIRELERQIGEMGSLQANAPVTPSGLGTSPPVETEDEDLGPSGEEQGRGVGEQGGVEEEEKTS
jgi:hypothetical protein